MGEQGTEKDEIIEEKENGRRNDGERETGIT